MRPLTNPLPPGSRIQITIVLEKTEFDTSNRQNKVGIPPTFAFVFGTDFQNIQMLSKKLSQD